MKVFILIVAVCILITGIIALPVQAFDVPTETTDNATDVILWHGDNLTIESVTGTITITDLETAIDSAAQVIADELATIAASFISFLIATLLTILAFWANRNSVPTKQHSPFLLLMACPVDLIYGLSLAAGSTVASAVWAEGIIVAIIGTFCLIKVILDHVIKKGDV